MNQFGVFSTMPGVKRDACDVSPVGTTDFPERPPSRPVLRLAVLTEIWARQCEAAAQSKGLTSSVSSLAAELAAVDDFPLSRVLRTESLDLDYLSDSRKPMV
jgi:hypothetical protein